MRSLIAGTYIEAAKFDIPFEAKRIYHGSNTRRGCDFTTETSNLNLCYFSASSCSATRNVSLRKMKMSDIGRLLMPQKGPSPILWQRSPRKIPSTPRHLQLGKWTIGLSKGQLSRQKWTTNGDISGNLNYPNLFDICCQMFDCWLNLASRSSIHYVRICRFLLDNYGWLAFRRAQIRKRPNKIVFTMSLECSKSPKDAYESCGHQRNKKTFGASIAAQIDTGNKIDCTSTHWRSHYSECFTQVTEYDSSGSSQTWWPLNRLLTPLVVHLNG